MDRYKVAIVDDDELSLDNLVFGLQKFENFHLEGTARNGVSGKKLIADQRKNLRVFFFKHTTSSVYIKRMPYLLPL